MNNLELLWACLHRQRSVCTLMLKHISHISGMFTVMCNYSHDLLYVGRREDYRCQFQVQMYILYKNDVSYLCLCWTEEAIKIMILLTQSDLDLL